MDKKNKRVEPIPEYTAKEEHEDRWRWRKVKVGDTEYTLDNKVIEPFKKVLSHGGMRCLFPIDRNTSCMHEAKNLLLRFKRGTLK